MSTDPSLLIQIIENNGYWLMGFLMVVEGPIVTLLSAFAASFHYFNIWFVLLLSLIGDFAGDNFHYWLGRAIKSGMISSKKYKEKTLKNIRKKIDKNLYGTLLTAKIASPLAGLTIVIVGTMGVPYWKFIKNAMLASLPLILIYISLGYFFGSAIHEILIYVKRTELVIAIMIVSILLLVIAYKFLGPKLFKHF